MKDMKTKERFVELRAKGWSFEKIAKELKVCKQTLINWSKELSIMISNLRAIELEALQEKYYSTKKARIELFGKRLEAIKKELEKRDLSEIPTAKLFELLERHGRILKEEAVDVTFQEEIPLDQCFDDLNTTRRRWEA